MPPRRQVLAQQRDYALTIQQAAPRTARMPQSLHLQERVQHFAVMPLANDACCNEHG